MAYLAESLPANLSDRKKILSYFSLKVILFLNKHALHIIHIAIKYIIMKDISLSLFFTVYCSKGISRNFVETMRIILYFLYFCFPLSQVQMRNALNLCPEFISLCENQHGKKSSSLFLSRGECKKNGSCFKYFP